MEALRTQKPLIVGEVLFDHFPDGHQVLGGAPFNVAWNLQRLGLPPTFCSAVGDDDEGREVSEEMKLGGLDLTGLQISERWPTGKVEVRLNNGQPSFRILEQQAYDDIRQPSWAVSQESFSLLYVGSLAYRNVQSRETIQNLIETSGLHRFVDINIRPPWFDRAWLPNLLGGAHWVKLNQEELAQVTKMECRSTEAIGLAAGKLRRQYGCRRCFITCGSNGAYAVDEHGDILFAEAPKPEPMVDTVGAGDAFSAATIFGFSQNRSLDEILQSAVRFASRTCSIQGATTTDREHFAQFSADSRTTNHR